MPDRDTPGSVASAWPMPPNSASSHVALRSVLRPFRTPSHTNSSSPVKISAPPTKNILSLRPCTALRMGSTANSGSVPTMMSRINRRAGGTGVGVVRCTRSPMPRNSSTTMSQISCQ